MILTFNSGYFLEEFKEIDVCNGDALCFLWGTDQILKYYLDNLRFKGLNSIYYWVMFWVNTVIWFSILFHIKQFLLARSFRVNFCWLSDW
jgi:hypothetical protein